jgi:very-short-patch-repair endonuclease
MSVARARRFRKGLTPQEAKLRVGLRELRPQGLHFRRQVPLDGYILDFICHRAKLIVEVDGLQHADDERRRRDERRDGRFARSGCLTLRFWNTEVERNLGAVLDAVFHTAWSRLSSANSARSGSHASGAGGASRQQPRTPLLPLDGGGGPAQAGPKGVRAQRAHAASEFAAPPHPSGPAGQPPSPSRGGKERADPPGSPYQASRPKHTDHAPAASPERYGRGGA